MFIMLVYRYLCEKELELIKNNKVTQLGNYFITNRMESNFKYDNQKYISFFKNKQDVIHFQKVNNDYYSSDNFIAQFDIPEKDLGETYIGKYSFNPNCEEYILLAKNFNCDWLKNYIPVTNEVSEQEIEF